MACQAAEQAGEEFMAVRLSFAHYWSQLGIKRKLP
jgi:hypothetical protein